MVKTASLQIEPLGTRIKLTLLFRQQSGPDAFLSPGPDTING